MAMLVPIKVCGICGHECFDKNDTCEHMKECEECNGTGIQCHNDHVKMYNDCPYDYDCLDCLHKGDPCPDCEGSGVV